MIDESRTLEIFGYISSGLSFGSGKNVVAVCEGCGKERVMRYVKYRDMCHDCACKTPASRAKISAANARRIWSDESRAKQSLAAMGRSPSLETRAKISAASTGRKSSLETRAKISAALTGIKHPNYGKKFSAEHRAKISAANMGRTPTAETRAKISAANTGKKSSNWKGGITPIMSRIRDSKVYWNWRYAVFKRDHFTCRLCGDSTGGNLQAHHIEPVRWHHDDLLMFDIDNGITLCKKCHEQVNWNEHLFIDQFKELIT